MLRFILNWRLKEVVVLYLNFRIFLFCVCKISTDTNPCFTAVL